MNYNPTKKVLQITPAEVDSAGLHFLYAIKHIRKMAGLPLTPYSTGDDALKASDFAMKGVIDGAAKLGIDLGAQWGNELDVSNAN